MATKYEKINLYRLILARNDISSAMFACRYFLENVKDVKDDLCLPLQESITISYARSFTNNNVIGCLKKTWRKVGDNVLQEIHDTILEVRKKQIAHNDPEILKVRIVPKGIFVQNPPQIAVKVYNYRFPIPFIEKAEKLCSLQSKRINAEIELELKRIYGERADTEDFTLDIFTDD